MVAGQTQASLENIHSHIQASALDVSVGSGPATAVTDDKRIHPINGLHVHRLPNGTALGIDGRNCLQNFSGAGFPVFRNKERLPLPSHLGAHGIPVDDHAAEPEIGLAVFFVIGVHFYRQIPEALLIALIDFFFSGDMVTLLYSQNQDPEALFLL